MQYAPKKHTHSDNLINNSLLQQKCNVYTRIKFNTGIQHQWETHALFLQSPSIRRFVCVSGNNNFTGFYVIVLYYKSGRHISQMNSLSISEQMNNFLRQETRH